MARWKFQNLQVWKKAMVLAREVYAATRGFPPDERYRVAAQLRAAAASIPSNIAEGQMRGTNGEYLRFLSIPLGSVGELLTQLLLTRDLGLLDEATADPLIGAADEIGRMLRGLQRALRSPP